MLLILRAAGVLSLLVAAGVRAITPIDDGPYHVFDSCQPIIDLYIDAAVNFTSCALNKSLPPVVCTNCMDEYKKLLNVFHWIREEKSMTGLGKRCSSAITQSHVVSYVQQHYDGIRSLWDVSACEQCVKFYESDDWFSPDVNTTDPKTVVREWQYSFSDSLGNYEGKLNEFRICLNLSSVEDKCTNEYDELYKFYWTEFIYPDVTPFCADIESSMNDTISLWREVLGCTTPALPQRSEQIAVTLVLSLLVLLITISFYVFSFVYTERKHKKFLKCKFSHRTTYHYKDSKTGDNHRTIGSVSGSTTVPTISTVNVGGESVVVNYNPQPELVRQNAFASRQPAGTFGSQDRIEEEGE